MISCPRSSVAVAVRDNSENPALTLRAGFSVQCSKVDPFVYRS